MSAPPLDIAKRRGWPRTTRTYRKKPVRVYAAQWNPRAKYWPPKCFQHGYKSYVETANGPVEIQIGTWICWQKIRGKFDAWPVAEEIFKATYESA